MQAFLELMGIEPLSNDELMMMSPLKFAYLGDAIYEMYIRTYLINTKKAKLHQLNKMAVTFVKASAQGYIAKSLELYLTEEEWTVLKRGRNQKSIAPRNANVSDYKYATGFEALIGYLFLTDKKERVLEILKESIRIIEERVENEN